MLHLISTFQKRTALGVEMHTQLPWATVVLADFFPKVPARPHHLASEAHHARVGHAQAKRVRLAHRMRKILGFLLRVNPLYAIW